jgi:uncharacterized protein YeaO (DUF488 family)
MITVRDLYDRKCSLSNRRFLVERSWPRKREGTGLHFEGWLKELAPSASLSSWFDQNRDKWPEFCRRYFAELDARPEARKLLLEEATHCTVELLNSSEDEIYNNAVALKQYLESKLGEIPHTSTDSVTSENLTRGALI